MIAALLATPRDHDAAARAVGVTSSIRFCATARELQALTATAGVTAVLCELHDSIGGGIGPVARTIRARATPMPFLLVISPSRSTVRQLVRLLAVDLAVHVVVRDTSNFGNSVEALLMTARSGSAHTAILQRLNGALPEEALEIVLACILLGFPKSGVQSVAGVLGVSGRTLERRLAAARTLSPRMILAWSVVLNVAWRMERESMPLKSIVRHSGFPSSESLANAVRRACGHSPGRIVSRLGFDALLDCFCDQLRPTDD
jgi:AraC-like DNA-binding protein